MTGSESVQVYLMFMSYEKWWVRVSIVIAVRGVFSGILLGAVTVAVCFRLLFLTFFKQEII